MDGYCGVTNYEVADCYSADRGAWTLHERETTSWPAAMDACFARCSRCSRCNVISVSQTHRDCSWFHRCDLNHTKLDVAGFRSALMDTKTTTWKAPSGRVAAKCAGFERAVRDSIEGRLARSQREIDAPELHEAMLAQAWHMALEEPRLEMCDCIPCSDPTGPDMATLRSWRRSSSAFVYLTTAGRRAALRKSLDSLYSHYNDVARTDVLVFHSGDLTPAVSQSVSQSVRPVRPPCPPVLSIH